MSNSMYYFLHSFVPPLRGNTSDPDSGEKETTARPHTNTGGRRTSPARDTRTGRRGDSVAVKNVQLSE